jgi:hypothetical protein
MYLKSSKAGKGLYEKFGWRCIGEHGEKGVTTDLKVCVPSLVHSCVLLSVVGIVLSDIWNGIGDVIKFCTDSSPCDRISDLSTDIRIGI